MKKFIILSLALFLIGACSIKPSKIEYGSDSCHYCKMTIVEKAHAAQIVTKKGKPYKYDAIECLLLDINERDKNGIELFLVTDYLTPEKLIDANLATFLISESIKSPMGANLSAFELKDKASEMVKNNNDKLFNWLEIQQRFSK